MHTLEGQWTFINVHNGFKFFLKEQSHFCTGKSFSEALILESVNLQYTLSVLRIFVHFHFLSFLYAICNTAYLLPIFFVKLQCSVLKNLHLTIFFFKHHESFYHFFSLPLICFLWRHSAWKCI